MGSIDTTNGFCSDCEIGNNCKYCPRTEKLVKSLKIVGKTTLPKDVVDTTNLEVLDVRNPSQKFIDGIEEQRQRIEGFESTNVFEYLESLLEKD